jgi:hypothetical protein
MQNRRQLGKKRKFDRERKQNLRKNEKFREFEAWKAR